VVSMAKINVVILLSSQVAFEINVSVPKGVGKAESEGGSGDNTVGQAFIRDPDGYYLEICNCHLLTDFVLGLTNGDRLLDGYAEGTTKNVSTVFASTMLFMKAMKSKRNSRRFNLSSSEITKALPMSDQPREADPNTLNTFIKRSSIYGDICQSFSPEQLDQILREADNFAPTAILLMKERIKSGEATRVYQPPAYYVGEVDKAVMYKPVALVAGADEKGKYMDKPAEMSAGVRRISSVAHPTMIECDVVVKTSVMANEAKMTAEGGKDGEEIYKTTTNAEEKKDDDEIDFEISSVNHIAFIVSDVGRSITFYSGVLGLQQVKRPNFDRHGAWFTGGNVEIHLILGNPLAPPRSTKGLEANAIWFVVENFDVAKANLTELSATSDEDLQLEMSSENDDEQFATCRDPDGYVFGICAK